jgi:hypothetical protein
MKTQFALLTAVATTTFLLSTSRAPGEIRTVVEHNDNDHAEATFKFKSIPSPSSSDAATKAKISILRGEQDGESAGVEKLQDGKVPTEKDQPSENFFFSQSTRDGRLMIDLGKIIEVKTINTYSWHPDTRGPQVYELFASDELKGDPGKTADLAKAGWKHIAKVDTRPKSGDGGGQYAVSITDSEGSLGKFKYLVFDMTPTEVDDPFGNTFYSEIDVIDASAPEAASAAPANDAPEKVVLESGGGAYKITLDTTEAPDLTEWAQKVVAPMAVEWYPKLIKMLPSEGFEPPAAFSIIFSTNATGVAATGGTRIRCAAKWFRSNLKGEALGAVFHEIVHVVQQYGRARRNNPNATRTPGWLQEGIPDCIRWYTFEPELHGADITKRNLSRAKYDGMYRISANFLNWATLKYDKDLIQKLNASLRNGNYHDEQWKDYTGHTVQELNDEWRADLEKKLGVEPAPSDPPKPASAP